MGIETPIVGLMTIPNNRKKSYWKYPIYAKFIVPNSNENH